MKNTTRISIHINAPREKVYKALINDKAITGWRVPDSMSCTVHHFDARVGGTYLISLIYDKQEDIGKTNRNTDRYHGRFTELIPNEKVVEIDEFETNDPDMKGEMKLTFTLSDSGAGTELKALHENVPVGISLTDNETGWRQALNKLKVMMES